jgi:23S rRNA pseudouridine1911/1915/1917 synthase
VHLSEQVGTPLLADWLYGATPKAPDLEAIASTLGRHALHAAVLGFEHPITKAALRFESPLPADLQAALTALRALKA